jgi:hypothetical protein
LEISGDIFGCHNEVEDATGTKCVEARDAAEYLTMRRTAHCKELTGAKSQEYPGRKTLPYIMFSFPDCSAI